MSADKVCQIATVRDLCGHVPSWPYTIVFGMAAPMADLESRAGGRPILPIEMSVRDLHWRLPPFLAARRLGHQRLHALIFGFGSGGEAVMTDLLLCCLVGNLGKPMVTIVDPRAAEIRRSLAQRCPALGDSVDYCVIDPGVAANAGVLPVADLAAAVARAPISLAYVSINDDERALALAGSLQALFRSEGWQSGPIFTRLVDGGVLPDGQDAIEGDSSAPLVGFGAAHDLAAPVGRFAADAEAMARMFHEAYRRTAADDAVANLPWEALSEDLRSSNRRLLVHLPAKLATAGVGVADWLAHTGPERRADGGLPLPDLAADPALLEALAELEHRRWMMERHLAGWQYGPTRDDARRIHPGLLPFTALDDSVRQHDRAMVEAAWAALGSNAGTGFFPTGGGMTRP